MPTYAEKYEGAKHETYAQREKRLAKDKTRAQAAGARQYSPRTEPKSKSKPKPKPTPIPFAGSDTRGFVDDMTRQFAAQQQAEIEAKFNRPPLSQIMNPITGEVYDTPGVFKPTELSSLEVLLGGLTAVGNVPAAATIRAGEKLMKGGKAASTVGKGVKYAGQVAQTAERMPGVPGVAARTAWRAGTGAPEMTLFNAMVQPQNLIADPQSFLESIPQQLIFGAAMKGGVGGLLDVAGQFAKRGATPQAPRPPAEAPFAQKGASDVAPVMKEARPFLDQPDLSTIGGESVRARRPVRASTKEPWEIPKEQWVRETSYDYPGGDPATHRRVLDEAHEHYVAKAIRDGKTVPPVVLKDYPQFATEPVAGEGLRPRRPAAPVEDVPVTPQTKPKKVKAESSQYGVFTEKQYEAMVAPARVHNKRYRELLEDIRNGRPVSAADRQEFILPETAEQANQWPYKETGPLPTTSTPKPTTKKPTVGEQIEVSAQQKAKESKAKSSQYGGRLRTKEGAIAIEAARQELRGAINAKYDTPAARADAIEAARQKVDQLITDDHVAAAKRLRETNTPSSSTPPAPRTASDIQVGEMVTFSVPTLHGQGKAAGLVKLIKSDGSLEIKSQNGGYYTLRPSEVSRVSQQFAPPPAPTQKASVDVEAAGPPTSEVKRVQNGPRTYVLYDDGAVRVYSGGKLQAQTPELSKEARRALEVPYIIAGRDVSAYKPGTVGKKLSVVKVESDGAVWAVEPDGTLHQDLRLDTLRPYAIPTPTPKAPPAPKTRAGGAIKGEEVTEAPNQSSWKSELTSYKAQKGTYTSGKPSFYGLGKAILSEGMILNNWWDIPKFNMTEALNNFGEGALKRGVENALKQGKTIPREAIDLWPDLQSKPAPPPPKAPAPKTAKGGGEDVTGARKAITEPERAKRGLDPIEMQEYKKYSSAYEQGRRAVETSDLQPRALAIELAEKPRALTPDETGALVYDRQRMNNALKSAYKEADDALTSGDNTAYQTAISKVDSLLDALDKNDQALRKGGREASAALSAFKIVVKEDYSLTTLLQKARIKKGGKLTAQEQSRIVDLQSKLDEATKVLEKYRADSQSIIKQLKPDSLEYGTANRIITKERAAEIEASLKKKLSQMGAVPDATVVADLAELIVYHLEAGARWSGSALRTYLQEKHPNLDDATIDAAFEKAQADKRLKAATTRASKAATPKTSTGKPMTADRKLQMAKRRMEADMKRVDEAIEAVKQGKPIPERGRLAYDEEAKTLLKELQAKRAELRELSPTTSRKPMTAEQKLNLQKRGVETRIKRMEDALSKGKKLSRPAKLKADAELTKLRDKAKSLQAQIDAAGLGLKKSPKQTSDANRVEATKKRIEKRINLLQKAIDTGKPISKRTAKFNAEIAKLKEQANRVQAEYDAKYPKQPKTDMERLQATKKRMQGRITELEDAIAKREPLPGKRAPVQLDREAIDLKYNVHKLKTELDSIVNPSPKTGIIGESFGVLRTLKTVADFSAPFRQGALLAVGEPKAFWKSFAKMFRVAFSEKKYWELNESIRNHPNAPLAEQSRLYLAPDHYASTLAAREEAFVSKLLHKIPGVGRITRGSERAYNGFLNGLRMETFNKYANAMPDASPETMKRLATFINQATGRGTLGSFEKAAIPLADVFFSPRFVASRVQVWANLTNRDPAVRKIAAKNLVGFTGAFVLTLKMAELGGAEVETDPRSSDFGKIKIGNTRIDMSAGMIPLVRQTAQILTGKRKTGGKIKEGNRLDMAERLVRSKLSPGAGLAVNVIAGKNFIGDEYTSGNLPSIAFNELTPMVIQDIVEVAKNDGWLMTGPAGLVSVFGGSVTSYKAKPKKPKSGFSAPTGYTIRGYRP